MKSFFVEVELEMEIEDRYAFSVLADEFPKSFHGIRVVKTVISPCSPLVGTDRASYEFLVQGKHEVFALLEDAADNFDGTEYAQGKKDGLRMALARLGNPELLKLNQGGGLAREQGKPYPAVMYELERDEEGDAIVVRRGVFERYSNRVAWYVMLDGETRSLISREPNSVGTWWLEYVGREQNILPFLWDSPQEVFVWWAKNRENIAAFQADRARLLKKGKAAYGRTDSSS